MAMAKKILLIDDEPGLREMMSLRLKANNYNIVTASNGQEGLDMVKKENPDLVILDVHMPVMDGFQFFKIIKKDSQKSNIPILVLTARGQMKDTFEAFDADAFIPKPFKSEEVVAKVNFLLKNHVLFLNEDNFVSDKVRQAFQKLDYGINMINNEDSFLEEGKKEKYKVVVIHLALCTKEPKDLLLSMKMFKNREPKIILYCDAKVKGTEDNYTVAIDEIRKKWKTEGVEAFFDTRISQESFSDFLSKWLT